MEAIKLLSGLEIADNEYFIQKNFDLKTIICIGIVRIVFIIMT